jgi:hypothetical protein
MKKINFLLAFFMLISVNFSLMLAQDNYKLQPFGDADSDANALIIAGTYTDAQTAQVAIYDNEVASPWKFGTYETATQKFSIYSATNGTWNGTQWGSATGDCPITIWGQSFITDDGFSPVTFFVAPAAAIYKVSANFQYQSNHGVPTAGSSLFQFKANGGTSVVNMNFGKNYTDQTVLSSDFYVNMHAGDTISFNQTCTLWGDPFCVWTKIQVMGNDGQNPFTSTEANLSGFYFDNYFVATDFSYLNAKIAASETLISSGVQGTVHGTYPASATILFQSALDAAKSFVSTQPNATQLDINAQLATLTSAYTIFSNSFVITVNPDAANNYKLQGWGDADSDAGLLVAAGTYTDVQTAQKAIYHNETPTPWRFGSYETATSKFLIFTDATASWNGSQWGSLNNDCPITWDGYSFVFAADYSPVIFFVAPKSAIYLVSTNFLYASTQGKSTSGSDFFQFKSANGTPVVNMNFGGDYTQDNPTILADFFVNLHVGDTISFNQSCTVFGDPFCQWTALQVSGNDSGVAYTASEANGSGLYFDYYAGVSALNQTLTNNLKIIPVEKGIRVITDKVALVSVYNTTGMMVKNSIVKSDEVISLTQGAYIVKSGNTIQKVLVR